MKTFTIFWLTGKSEIIKGDNIAQAMTLSGYGNGAMRALDFYGNGDIRNDYNFINHEWKSIKKL